MLALTTQNERIVGNIGLHHVCCEMSRRGWEASLTMRKWKHGSRNVNPVNIILHNTDSTTDVTIQIMAVLDSKPVSFGNNPGNREMADFLILCRSVKNTKDESANPVLPIPDMFVMTKKEVVSALTKNTNSDYWLKESDYKLHKDKLEKIGFG